MLANKGDYYDVSIHWPRKMRRITSIRRSGRCPSHSVPRKLRNPGGLVALVAKDGEVLLLFRVSRIEEGVAVTAAEGYRAPRGCVLVAQKGTIRSPGPRDPRFLNVNRHAIGAFRYFDASTNTAVFVNPYDTRDGKGAQEDKVKGRFPRRSYPFFSKNIDKTLRQPERRLIRAYATWVGDITMFVHHALKGTRLFTDLFIPRCWTLIEAKATTDRRVLREALGQLFDYQRYYDRSPRLAVLLPKKPTRDALELFAKKRIVVIWQLPGGGFRDSHQGALTTDLRRISTEISV